MDKLLTKSIFFCSTALSQEVQAQIVNFILHLTKNVFRISKQMLINTEYPLKDNNLRPGDWQLELRRDRVHAPMELESKQLYLGFYSSYKTGATLVFVIVPRSNYRKFLSSKKFRNLHTAFCTEKTTTTTTTVLLVKRRYVDKWECCLFSVVWYELYNPFPSHTSTLLNSITE